MHGNVFSKDGDGRISGTEESGEGHCFLHRLEGRYQRSLSTRDKMKDNLRRCGRNTKWRTVIYLRRDVKKVIWQLGKEEKRKPNSNAPALSRNLPFQTTQFCIAQLSCSLPFYPLLSVSSPVFPMYLFILALFSIAYLLHSFSFASHKHSSFQISQWLCRTAWLWKDLGFGWSHSFCSRLSASKSNLPWVYPCFG